MYSSAFRLRIYDIHRQYIDEKQLRKQFVDFQIYMYNH